jgi:hypothetical protein
VREAIAAFYFFKAVLFSLFFVDIDSICSIKDGLNYVRSFLNKWHRSGHIRRPLIKSAYSLEQEKAVKKAVRVIDKDIQMSERSIMARGGIAQELLSPADRT